MIDRLLQIAPGWLWILLTIGGAGLLAWWRLDVVIAERDLAEARQASAERAAEVAMTTADWQRTQFESAIRALDDRQDALDAAADWVDARRSELESMENNDGEEAEWLDQPLPDGIADWVRRLPNESATADADVPGDAVVSDQPAASAKPAGG